MRVRVNSKYVYDPVPLDLFDGRTNLKKGEVVRVINLPNAPKANTMGHCYVEHLDGSWGGMVCCNSLRPVAEVMQARADSYAGSHRSAHDQLSGRNQSPTIDGVHKPR